MKSLVVFTTLLVFLLLNESSGQGGKKRNQQILKRKTTSSGNSDSRESAIADEDEDIALEILQKEEILDFYPTKVSESATAQKDACPKCYSKNFSNQAVFAYWNQDHEAAAACACQAIKSNPSDNISKSILYSLRSLKFAVANVDPALIVAPTAEPNPTLKTWEILGPINVGKLEIDGDSTFYNSSSSNFDVASRILSMPANSVVYSDLIAESKISWRKVSAHAQGQVDVHFNVGWNDLAQSLSSMAVYEYQAWARAITYVKTAGSYIVDCQGPHTVYLRNENSTRILIGDVYKAQQIRASVDLKPGLLGIVIPLRVVVQTQFLCTLYSAPPTINVSPPLYVPQIIQFDTNPGKGYLLSSVFALPVHNVLSQSITLEFLLEKPFGEENDYFIRVAKSFEDNSTIPISTTVAPGQTIMVPLEIISSKLSATSSSSSSSPQKDTLLQMTCRENRPFTIIVTPSKGPSVKQSLIFECRYSYQSFLFSFLSHDDSVAQAAVILPLDYHSPYWKQKLIGRNHHQNTKASRGTKSQKMKTDKDQGTCKADMNCLDHPKVEYKEHFQALGYPVLLTLHGSGITPLNHADAHKMMPTGHKEYIFGVEGYYLLAPSRFGAHNWEGVGDLTARTALKALAHFVQQSKGLFPPVLLHFGMIAGHSMGGHGAWITSTNAPNRFACAFPMSGWIKKEEYSTSNMFFSLDQTTSFTDPLLKTLLDQALSEYHVDRLISNLQTKALVHIRVGSHDSTTHPWFSRRMYRLLKQLQINTTIEETAGKQHWWWDTQVPNDGGVVNDAFMRKLYTTCTIHAKNQKELMLHYQIYLNETTSNPEGEKQITLKEYLMTQQQQPLENHQHVCSSRKNLTLSVINPALHEGYCGLQLMQQHQVMIMSQVIVNCDYVESRDDFDYNVLRVEKVCTMKTRNVRRLSLEVSFGTILFEADTLIVNNQPIDSFRSGGTMELCFTNQAVSRCSSTSMTTLSEKNLINIGPIRRVYDRPFYIVYGTPPNQALRIAMRDLAVYLGNAHFTSHHTTVQVLSDLEYRSGNYAKKAKLHNLMLIGDSMTNKLFRAIATAADATATNDVSSVKSRVRTTTIPVKGLIPLDVTLYGYLDVEDEEDVASLKRTNANSAAQQPQKNAIGFQVGDDIFSDEDHGIIFTMPIQNTQTNDVGMAVCIHANTVFGYMHLTRLSWPVIPPMVRAPFANYLPDFMVIDSNLWAEGFGGVVSAGYWDSDWHIDHARIYRK